MWLDVKIYPMPPWLGVFPSQSSCLQFTGINDPFLFTQTEFEPWSPIDTITLADKGRATRPSCLPWNSLSFPPELNHGFLKVLLNLKNAHSSFLLAFFQTFKTPQHLSWAKNFANSSSGFKKVSWPFWSRLRQSLQLLKGVSEAK